MTAPPTALELAARFRAIADGQPLNEWPVRLYISAPYKLRDQAVGLMLRLERSGYEVTSRWLRPERDGDLGYMSNEDQNRYAAEDLSDVRRAHFVVAIGSDAYMRSGTGGRHVELGYALALMIPVVLYGVRSNVFHYLSEVRVVEVGFDSLLDALRSVAPGDGMGERRPKTGDLSAAPQNLTSIPALAILDPARVTARSLDGRPLELDHHALVGVELCRARKRKGVPLACGRSKHHAGDHVYEGSHGLSRWQNESEIPERRCARDGCNLPESGHNLKTNHFFERGTFDGLARSGSSSVEIVAPGPSASVPDGRYAPLSTAEFDRLVDRLVIEAIRQIERTYFLPKTTAAIKAGAR